MARREKREGRGRLSSIDLLPAEADPHIQWAAEELLKRDLTQVEILQGFNARLAEIGCDPVSKSAFNRYSMQKAAATRALAETREVSKVVAETLGPERADHITIMLVELLKNAIFSLTLTGKLSSAAVLDLSRALRALIGAQRESGQWRKEDEKAFAEKADKAIAAASREAGLSADQVALIRNEVLGVRT